MTDTALVYIRKADETREFAGCGALIEGPYIATCRHVWRDAEGDLNGGVIVEFPRSLDGGGAPKRQSVGMADACNAMTPAPDLVLLSVGQLPAGVYPLPVATEDRFETGSGRIHAFKKSKNSDVFVNGTIQQGTTAKGLRQISGEAHSGYWTEKGSSGSPAFLDNAMQLAGILLLSETGDPPVREAFILPGSAIRRQLERIKADAATSKMGVSVADIEAAVPGLDLKDTPISEIAAKIATAVAAITAKAAEAPAASNSGTDIDEARAKAADKLGEMDTDGAMAVWDDLLAKDTEALETLTRRRVAMLAEKALIQRLQLEYDGALATMREIVRLDPDSFEYWNEIGDIEHAMGNVEKAQAAYQSALEASQRVGDDQDVSVSLERIGDMRSARNDLAGALKAYEEGLGIRMRLMAADPSHVERARDVSVSLNKIGDVRSARNALAGALKAYEEGLEIRRRLMAADPSHAERARDVSVSLNKIGDVRRARNDLAGALKAYEQGLEIRRRLMAADPSHAQRARDVSVSINKIGDVRRARNDLAGALPTY
jgi:tetratricopeptide (TPR) repeat protein